MSNFLTMQMSGITPISFFDVQITQQINFTIRNDLPIEISSGFLLNSKLSWNDHINLVCTKLSKYVYLIRHY